MPEKSKSSKMWLCSLLIIYGVALSISMIGLKFKNILPILSPFVLYIIGISLYLAFTTLQSWTKNLFLNIITYTGSILAITTYFFAINSEIENLNVTFPSACSIVLGTLWIATLIPKVFHYLHKVTPFITLGMLIAEIALYANGMRYTFWNSAFVAMNALSMSAAWAEMRQDENTTDNTFKMTLVMLVNMSLVFIRMLMMDKMKAMDFFLIQSAVTAADLIAMTISLSKKKKKNENEQLMQYQEALVEDQQENIPESSYEENSEMQDTQYYNDQQYINENVQSVTDQTIQFTFQENNSEYQEGEYERIMREAKEYELETEMTGQSQEEYQEGYQKEYQEQYQSESDEQYDEEDEEYEDQYQDNAMFILDEEIPAIEVPDDFEVKKALQKERALQLNNFFGSDAPTFMRGIQVNI